MKKSLVVVESPAKARTIGKYLGSDYLVKSCVGHIRDLPTSGGPRKSKKDLPELPPEGRKYAKLIQSMGINPYKDWEAQYGILPGKKKLVNELVSLADSAKDVYLATDLDREGEAIAWHLATILGIQRGYKRVTFTEITQAAIKEAFAQPEKINQDRVEAQQARRFLDRTVGYMLSPLLWKKVARNLSAGRVQSVAVKLIVEREREIREFVPEEYWLLDAELFTAAREKLMMQVTKCKGKTFKPTSKEEMDQALAELKKGGKQVLIAQLDKKQQLSRPSPPFITSTLQQTANSYLRYSVRRTMVAAQRLYEAGYITYMRTDSFNLSRASVQQGRIYIKENFGAGYLPPQPRAYKAKVKKGQEAHEAIRPTNIRLRAEGLPASMGAAERKLYDLIRRRFIACQMKDAVYDTVKAVAEKGDYQLQANGRTLRFDGWTKIIPAPATDKLPLPPLRKGEMLELDRLNPQQKFTSPPRRWNEGSLVKELERLGIGRPSTYAPIISAIQQRGYVRLEKRKFHAERIAEIVTNRLNDNFPNIMEYGFTASIEDELDAISAGEKNWKEMLNEFYRKFVQQLDKADAQEGGMRQNELIKSPISCPDCDKAMLIRNTAQGIFLSCAGYADKENQCKKTMNLTEVQTGDMEIDELTAVAVERLSKRRSCPLCGCFMIPYILDKERCLHMCARNPDCEGVELEEGNFKAQGGVEDEKIACDKCGDQMTLHSSRFGRYFACNSCANKRKVLANGTLAPPRMIPIQTDIPCQKYPDEHYIIREGALGLFLSAPGYPQKRETRSPYIKEVSPYRDKLETRFHFLTDAPAEDEEGNPTQIRYSRKKGVNYLLSVKKDGKDTGWRAYYEDGNWRVMREKRRARRAKAAATV